MLKRIAVILTAATVLGLAAPANAQVIYGGGWWGGPYHHRYIYNYYPRHHFIVVPHRHFYGFHRSWWGGY